jgi:hypothetical protein
MSPFCINSFRGSGRWIIRVKIRRTDAVKAVEPKELDGLPGSLWIFRWCLRDQPTRGKAIDICSDSQAFLKAASSVQFKSNLVLE